MKQILALFADFANGIFAVLLASYVTQTEVVWWYFIVGVLLAMLPDLDAVPELLSRGKVAASREHQSDHRDGLHFPILFLILGIIGALYFGFFGYLFLFATMLHFVNDLYGTGWGIALFWPVSKRKYKFFGRRANQLKRMLVQSGAYDQLPSAEKKLRFIVSWSEKELHDYIRQFGFENWIAACYLTVNWISVVEYSLFVTAVILMFSTLLY